MGVLGVVHRRDWVHCGDSQAGSSPERSDAQIPTSCVFFTRIRPQSADSITFKSNWGVLSRNGAEQRAIRAGYRAETGLAAAISWKIMVDR